VASEETRRGRRPGEQTKIETKLAAWRVKRGMTQAELANAAGLPLSTYWNYERGRVRDPGVITLSRLAHILGCKLSDLVEDDWDWFYVRKVAWPPKPDDPKVFWRRIQR
jgi:transcriptional regulator with XRE-family HTH domain